VLRANRKLVTIANEMRAVHRGIASRFALPPDAAAALEAATAVCAQIAVAESFLVVEGVKGSGEFRFDLEEQARLLDGLACGGRGDCTEVGDLGTGTGRSMVRDYHLLLIELHRLRLRLQETLAALSQS
jgi:hypothetical protein